MRILVSRFAAEVGGAEKSYFAHLKAYQALNHNIVAFTNLPVPDTVSAKIRPALWFRSANPAYKALVALPQLFQCWQLVVTNHIEVINAHSRFDQVAFTLLKPLHRRPVVWKDPLEVREHLAKPPSLTRFLYVAALKRADKVYVLSQAQKHNLLPALPKSFDKEKVVVIPSGIDFSGYNLSAQPGYPRDGTALGYAARLHPAKGVDHLLRAFSIAQKSVGDINLLIMGEGEQLESLRVLAQELKLGSSVEFLPYNKDVSPFLRSLNIYVCPSMYESWGLGVHEARLFGLPIIASDVGGLAEQLTDKETGLLVPAGDHQALAAAIIKLVQDKQLANRLGNSARADVIKQGDFSETVKNKLIPLLEEVR